MLELEKISFSYPNSAEKKVLDGIDLRLNSGEFLVVLGSNGAGKSTLLKIISGALAPSSGSVKFADKNLNEYAAKYLATKRSFLEQDSQIAFDSACLEVVLLGRYAYGKFSADASDVAFAKKAMSELGLSGFEKRFFFSLSGGEKRRVMLAKTLCQLYKTSENYEGSMLLLDEPSSALDPSHAHDALLAAKKLSQKGAGVIAILHDPNLAVQYADKILFLKEGKSLGFFNSADAINEKLLSETYSCKCKIISDANSNYLLFLKE